MKFHYQSLKSFHTFRTNIFAKKIIIVRTIKKLISIYKKYRKQKLPFLILGEGSNVLFTHNYHGIIIINKIVGINIHTKKKYWLLHVKGGVKWHNLVKYTIQKKIYGLENLALIPGSVGAAPIQNIGAYGIEFKNVCKYVDVLSLKNSTITRIKTKNCLFSYRNSIFKKQNNPDCIIVAVGIKLPNKWSPTLSYFELKKLNPKTITAYKIFCYICKLRRKKIPDPKKTGNAGSFFKNPIIEKKKIYELIRKYRNIPYFFDENDKMIKISAGWLIEQCKLKGFSIGNAKIYHKKALILINKNNLATPQEIITLSQIIILNVEKKFKITLKPEVKIIN